MSPPAPPLPSLWMTTTLHGPQRQQQTLSTSVQVSGFGFWSGQDVTLEFRPAAANSGVVFLRHDVHPIAAIPARVEYRVESPRRTTLSHGGVDVEMVEHVMAALSGLRIDNCEVWSNAAEMPGMDGSAQAFTDALRTAGVVQQDAPRPYLMVSEVTRVGDEDCWVEARPSRHPVMSLQYRLDYGLDHAIGRETVRATMETGEFLRELAPARTFLTEQEAEWIRNQGLAKRVTPQDVLVFGELGVIDNHLRLEKECAAHKVLDMVGDLALAGCDLIGQFVAHRSGHRLNAEIVHELLSQYQVIDDWRQSA